MGETKERNGEIMPKITLKAARVNAGLSQKEVAERMEVAQSTIRNWENGHTDPKLPQFMMLCQLYNVSCDNIFFEHKIS